MRAFFFAAPFGGIEPPGSNRAAGELADAKRQQSPCTVITNAEWYDARFVRAFFFSTSLLSESNPRFELEGE